MTTFELEEYLEAHSQIVDNFRDKYAAFLNEQNADRPTIIKSGVACALKMRPAVLSSNSLAISKPN